MKNEKLKDEATVASRSGWPIVAICYDFDKTLSPKDMQEYSFIPQVGMSAEKFWSETARISTENNTDLILAYMYLMTKAAKESKDFDFTKGDLNEIGKKIELFEGVSQWFDEIKKVADELQISVEHYVISAGIKEMIEGCSIAKNFKHIYASSFMYDNHNEPIWPSRVVNYTNKTQFIFRVNKGCLNELDDLSLNASVCDSARRVPFGRMVYVGDSATDIPCMALVKRNGGYSIGVFNPDDQTKGKSYDLIRDNRINFYAPADYSTDGQIYKIIVSILRKIKFEYELGEITLAQRDELKKP